MDKVEYSLAIITRGQPEQLDRLLDSYGQFPNEIVVVNTGIDESEEKFKEVDAVVLKHKEKLFHFPWCEDFAKARNFSYAKCTKPFILWLDTDDVVERPKNLDYNIRLACGGGADVLYMDYVYERDQFGNETAVQRRERVSRRGAFRWSEKAPIHEVLVADGHFNPVNVPPQGGRIIHDRISNDVKRARECLRRNKRVFEANFGPGKAVPEMRMVYYHGATLLGLGDIQGALDQFLEYEKRAAAEGNMHGAEKMQNLLNAAICYTALERYEEAWEYTTKAMLLCPHSPTASIEMAKTALRRGDQSLAAVYARLTLDRQQYASYELVSSPREIDGRPHMILATCAAKVGKFDEALEECAKAEKYFRADPVFLQLKFELQQTLRRRDIVRSFANLRDQLRAEQREKDVAALAKVVPDAIFETPDVQMFSEKPRPTDKPTVAIVCPPIGVPWGPWSIKQGIGGSEEAVINASRELAKLGWHVEVYAHTGRPCKDGPRVDEHGVYWYRFEAWSGRYDAGLDVAISWRHATLFGQTGVNAKVKVLWLHDIFNPNFWHAGAVDAHDHFFLLSDYHRSLFPMVPDEKVFRTENGVDASLFVPLEDLKNEPHHMIWGSDPSRGCQFLLPWWKTIREAVPDATLDIFYGWSQVFFEHAKQYKPLMEAHDQIESLKAQPGINWRGRVGQDVLAKEFARAAVWPYMTNFPEIHCITALKAQAHGCVPITVDDFALKETVQYGVKLAGNMAEPARQKEFVDRLIEELRNPTSSEKRQEMARWARSKTWASTISRWSELFLTRLQKSAPSPSMSLTS